MDTMGKKRKASFFLNSSRSDDMKRIKSLEQQRCEVIYEQLQEEIQQLQKTIKELENRIRELELPTQDWSDTYIN